jgi:hypothetical protein
MAWLETRRRKDETPGGRGLPGFVGVGKARRPSDSVFGERQWIIVSLFTWRAAEWQGDWRCSVTFMMVVMIRKAE